jgi:hypothetical protein
LTCRLGVKTGNQGSATVSAAGLTYILAVGCLRWRG